MSSDTHLGAENFDSRVVMHRIDKFKWKYKKDIHVNARAVIRLDCARACEAEPTVERKDVD